jgi:hypothetical protein
MSKKSIFAVVLVISMGISAQTQNQAYLDYIDQWKETAVQNQAEFGIPASIIMAQALLESAAGQSELAKRAKNHFGIKCTSDWTGGTYQYDAERRNECFRKYSNAAESFKDHALFLKRPRYASCFEIAVEDYEGWAYRLRECGYATDKQYAPKLIKLIEDYRLDTLAKGGKKKRPLKAEVVHKTEPIKVITRDPEPPYVAPLTAREEHDKFMESHPKKKCNGVPYVVALEGDTYSNIAFRLNVRERDLREDNDALGRELEVGDRIYLGAKKSTGVNTYTWSHPGQSLWQLCQEEGVKVEAVQLYNELDPNIRTFTIRQRIYLRKVKEDGNL